LTSRLLFCGYLFGCSPELLPFESNPRGEISVFLHTEQNIAEGERGDKYAILSDKGTKENLVKGAMFMPRQKKTTVCPLGGDGLGGKWQFWILHQLLSGTKRFGELRRLLPEVSRQMLTIQLRELEQMGFLRRHAYEEVPPKVEYSLTDLGWSLEPFLRQMERWGTWYSEQIGPQYDWLVSLGGRWKLWIWYHLLSGPKRFGELQQQLPQANRQTLTVQLRELEQMGVLHRQASARVPAKVEYVLTDLGQQSEAMLRQMYAWGKWCCEQIGVTYDDWPVGDEAQARLQDWQRTGAVSSSRGTELVNLSSGL
jgi:DNA-binding HxlR family transcriptional regulator